MNKRKQLWDAGGRALVLAYSESHARELVREQIGTTDHLPFAQLKNMQRVYLETLDVPKANGTGLTPKSMLAKQFADRHPIGIYWVTK